MGASGPFTLDRAFLAIASTSESEYGAASGNSAPFTREVGAVLSVKRDSTRSKEVAVSPTGSANTNVRFTGSKAKF
ncbi:hypothetical protein MT325_m311R [Paramecium bursaria chlorella virus MT325]|uniref:Uncharacterized protein m311R n=1 Tax=Paramecium bursaria Chlorella virus MT325 TaxID=346932 RepID=A7IU41_PBCVM|nr:hypothetical protein MT325_m311R [Paramecium bursaria chlorella virus MT325]